MFGQVGGGYQGIEPILLLNDPYFTPSAYSPYGQHWLHTTKVTYAWRLVGYDQPYTVDHNNPNRTIAIIDTGIDMDHPEFGGDGQLPPKIHPASATFVDEEADLTPNCLCNPDSYEPPDPEGGPTDVQDVLWTILEGVNPHGTIEAGISGAYAQNGAGIAGVCWDCSLLVLRVTPYADPPDEDCQGCRASAVSVAACVRYAAGWNPGLSETDDSLWSPVRARVICTAFEAIEGYNYASEFCDPTNPLNLAIDMACARGCIIVAIAGNYTQGCLGPDNGPEPDDATCTPAGGFLGEASIRPLAWHSKTIAVGGACRTGQRWHCHSRTNPLPSALGGCVDLHYPQHPIDSPLPVLSVVAPIEDMIATFVYDLTQNPPGALYGFLNENVAGTSWASPQVAGIVALMLGVNPALTFEDVKYILEVTATDIGVPGYDQWTGAGLVNARKAVEYVMKYTLPADWNGDGNIETLDAALYITDYTKADAMTDLNLDTIQSTDDMGIFLDSYAGE
ncbi:MAG: hypothetical protein DYG94_00710 [Leptolyngbya sp. PLA3]|nr:MAG: hypothetical protein EDM82_01165 [Cyanobacteria bacterium CYA]MCE7967254.1 hypothetical protein [Leptolyngbya sp. PL-A3]